MTQKYFFALLLFCAVAGVPCLSAQAAQGPQTFQNPLALYGDQVAFDVVRNGSVVGAHVTRFEKQADDLVVRSSMNIDIGVLFIPVYGFRYNAEETWRDGQLTALDVKVRDGGDDFAFMGQRADQGFRIQQPEKEYAVAGPLLTTNHWNAAVVGYDQVLNTLTGNMNEVRILNQGIETIPVAGGTLKATRYDYTGELRDTSVWYDDQGRWVRLQFLARDGSTIVYQCRSCLAQGNPS